MNRKQAEGEHPSAVLHKWRLSFSRKNTLNSKAVGGQNKNNNCMNLMFLFSTGCRGKGFRMSPTEYSWKEVNPEALLQ